MLTRRRRVVAAGPATVRGYALAGGVREVARVEVSADGGATWAPAELLERPRPWAWRPWEAARGPGARRARVGRRAWDNSRRAQPEDAATLWNPKGYVNNARPRTRLRI